MSGFQISHTQSSDWLRRLYEIEEKAKSVREQLSDATIDLGNYAEVTWFPADHIPTDGSDVLCIFKFRTLKLAEYHFAYMVCYAENEDGKLNIYESDSDYLVTEYKDVMWTHLPNSPWAYRG